MRSFTPRRHAHAAITTLACLLTHGRATSHAGEDAAASAATPPFPVMPVAQSSAQGRSTLSPPHLNSPSVVGLTRALTVMSSPPALSWPGASNNQSYLALGIEMPIIATAGAGSTDSAELLFVSPENYLLFVQQGMALDGSTQLNMSGGLLSSAADPFVSFEEPTGLFSSISSATSGATSADSSSSSSSSMRLLAVLLYTPPTAQPGVAAFNWTAWAADMSANPSLRMNFDIQDFTTRSGLGDPVAAEVLIVQDEITTPTDNPDDNSQSLVPISTVIPAGGQQAQATDTTASSATGAGVGAAAAGEQTGAGAAAAGAAASGASGGSSPSGLAMMTGAGGAGGASSSGSAAGASATGAAAAGQSGSENGDGSGAGKGGDGNSGKAGGQGAAAAGTTDGQGKGNGQGAGDGEDECNPEEEQGVGAGSGQDGKSGKAGDGAGAGGQGGAGKGEGSGAQLGQGAGDAAGAKDGKGKGDDQSADGESECDAEEQGAGGAGESSAAATASGSNMTMASATGGASKSGSGGKSGLPMMGTSAPDPSGMMTAAGGETPPAPEMTAMASPDDDGLFTIGFDVDGKFGTTITAELPFRAARRTAAAQDGDWTMTLKGDARLALGGLMQATATSPSTSTLATGVSTMTTTTSSAGTALATAATSASSVTSGSTSLSSTILSSAVLRILSMASVPLLVLIFM